MGDKCLIKWFGRHHRTTVIFVKFDYIVFIFKAHRLNGMEISCLDLFNGRNKWYKSEKQLPVCVCYRQRLDSQIHQNFIHETGDEYVHFMHHSLDHVKINMLDLVPHKLKNIYVNAFELAVFGFVRQEIGKMHQDKAVMFDIPNALKYLITHYFTYFV